jgi:hypothetical protein
MTNRPKAFAAFAFGVTLCGCAHEPPRVIGAPVLDSRFGEAVTRARAMQIINPEGVPVNDRGYSGKAAHNAIERYDGRAVQVPSSNHSSSQPPSSNALPNGAAQASR